MKRESYLFDVPDTAPTPREVFFNRRAFIRSAALGIAGGAASCARITDTRPIQDGDVEVPGLSRGDADLGAPDADGEAGRDPRTVPALEYPEGFDIVLGTPNALPEAIAREFDEVTARLTAGSHCNYYEFLPGRGGDVYPFTTDFEPAPWSVAVSGACHKPTTFSLDDLWGFQHEERLYHFRCVERWCMNVPWVGFPLRDLLERVEPDSSARFVRFVCLKRPSQMPGQAASSRYPWPYFEGLRLDEAMNPLAFVATGVYGEPLPAQHGSPLRLALPWKYGYKGPKAAVAIELLTVQPATFWSSLQPHEYGFLSNVNPNIPHPRWSQEASFPLGKPPEALFPTPIFNGYGEFVADLYPDEPTTPQEPLSAGQIAR